MDHSPGKKYAAEAIGTAVLVLVGCGAVTIGEVDGRSFVDVIGIAFAFGLAVTAMAYGIGPVSGCHINPAVTVGMLAAGRMPTRDAIAYIIAQCVGGVIGAGLLLLILRGKIGGYDLAAGGLGQNGWGEGYLGQYGLGSALLVEFLATLIFVTVILGSTNPTANLEVAGLIIGLTLFALHFPFINVTGLAQLWLFLIVPIVAGGVAGFLFRERALAPTLP
jgi:aquaporin Z